MKNSAGLYANIAFAVLLMISFFLIYFSIVLETDFGSDTAEYILQANSIITNSIDTFMADSAFAMERSPWALGPVAYPWGFPVLLALTFLVAGNGIIACKSIAIISFFLFLLVLWTGFRRHHPSWQLLLVIALFAFNPVFVKFMNDIGSDIPFLFLSTLSIVLIGKVIVHKERIVSRFWDHALLGVVAFAAFAVRTNGILLVGAILAAQISPLLFFHNRLHVKFAKLFLAQCLLPYIAFGVCWLIWERYFPQGGASHLAMLKNISLESLRNGLSCNIDLLSQIFPIKKKTFRVFFYVVTVPLAFFGMFTRYKTDFHSIFYVAATFALYVVWPFPEQGIRFLFPIFPFYFSFVFSGIASIRNAKLWFPAFVLRTVLTVRFVFIPVTLLSLSLAVAEKNIENDRKKDEYDSQYLTHLSEAFSYIRDNTAPDAVVVSADPRLLNLKTQRRSAFTTNPDDLFGEYLFIFHTPVKFDRQISGSEVDALLKKNALRLVLENGSVSLYKIVRGSS